VTTAVEARDIAIGAAAAAGVLLLAVLYLAVTLRRMRRGQRLVVGTDSHDLVEYAMSLLARVEQVEGRATTVEAAAAEVGTRVDRCLERRSMLRYDAIEGASGRQSVTIALMDASRSGLILSAIQGRDYARIYMKELERGRASVALSPEEQEAVDRAMGRG
jgi:HAMP domain-containing protein